MQWKIDLSDLLLLSHVSSNEDISIANPSFQLCNFSPFPHHHLGWLDLFSENRSQNERKGAQEIHRPNIRFYGMQNRRFFVFNFIL